MPLVFGLIACVAGVVANLYCQTLQFPVIGEDATLYAGVFNYRTRGAWEIGDDGDFWVYY